MSDNSAITPYSPETGLVITTLDGQEITLAPGASIVDFMPGGEKNEPLWQIKIGQTNDPNCPDASGAMNNPRMPQPRFYLIRTVRNGDTREKQIAGPIDAPLMVYPIGFRMARLYYATKYDLNSPTEAACRSHGGWKPYARFEGTVLPNSGGVIAGLCAALDTSNPQRPRTVEVCPLAKGKTVDGKFVPPLCQPQFIICCAVSIDGQMYVAEAMFKATSATSGKQLIRELTPMQKVGEPLWTRTIKLTPKAANMGNSFVGELLPEPNGLDQDPDTVDGMKVAEARWKDALTWLDRQAAMTREEIAEREARNNGSGGTQDVAAPADVMNGKPAANGKNGVNGKNGKGKKGDVEVLF
jgi:hypothetical protein